MFSWFWRFLYMLTASMFAIIDGIIDCAKMLCGIDPITVDGSSTDFLTFIVSNDKVMTGFKVAAILGISVVCFFAIVGIIRLVVKEKVDDTPAKIIGRAAKALLTFCFVPVLMFAFIWVMNVFASAMYQGTLGDSNATMGKFLFGAFSVDAVNPTVPIDEASNFFLRGDFDYKDYNQVITYIDPSSFDYFFAWVSSFALLWALARSILVFVERAFSIAVLFIASPFSISASVIDDGQHFKLWRDQILSKFISGYAVLITLNIYIAVVSVISSSSVVFFQSSTFLNNLIKIGIIVGGALSMQKIMSVIGSLVSSNGGGDVASAVQTADGLGRSVMAWKRRRDDKKERRNNSMRTGQASSNGGAVTKPVNGISGDGKSNNTFTGGNSVAGSEQRKVNDIIADTKPNGAKGDNKDDNANHNLQSPIKEQTLDSFLNSPSDNHNKNQISPTMEIVLSQNQSKVPSESKSGSSNDESKQR